MLHMWNLEQLMDLPICSCTTITKENGCDYYGSFKPSDGNTGDFIVSLLCTLLEDNLPSHIT